MTQRLLHGARPYPDVVAFADSFLAEAERPGAIRGRAFALTLRGEANCSSVPSTPPTTTCGWRRS
ncbi:hypothetical protein ACFQ34_03365 [Pseudonocardia benzenivorans]|uniref:Uncharacterized protein n=2 Tax=Pseudonocardia TaxID=1847 RepID=F4CS40_PSEUX|nr:hypothetical protein [Pseudonocardia dioxanivorans]AEA28484.1 hypothetical protein Psed_6388 [Pseudonocardia dioxanivorans CB1190]